MRLLKDSFWPLPGRSPLCLCLLVVPVLYKGRSSWADLNPPGHTSPSRQAGLLSGPVSHVAQVWSVLGRTPASRPESCAQAFVPHAGLRSRGPGGGEEWAGLSPLHWSWEVGSQSAPGQVPAPGSLRTSSCTRLQPSGSVVKTSPHGGPSRCDRAEGWAQKEPLALGTRGPFAGLPSCCSGGSLAPQRQAATLATCLPDHSMPHRGPGVLSAAPITSSPHLLFYFS